MGTSRLTILFDDPFWIGLYEREDDAGYSVCRIVFGGEPRDQEIYAYLLEHWRTLRFSPPGRGQPARTLPKAPSGASGRPAGDPDAGHRHQGPAGPPAPAGAGRPGAKAARRARDEAEEKRKFQLRQEKKKQKHRGR